MRISDLEQRLAKFREQFGDIDVYEPGDLGNEPVNEVVRLTVGLIGLGDVARAAKELMNVGADMRETNVMHRYDLALACLRNALAELEKTCCLT